MELFYSKAVVRLMPYADSMPMLDMTRPTLIGHTNAGGADLYSWFSRPGNQICSHFQIFWDGRVEQYLPLNRVAWAQFAGNAFAWSAEHQDDGDITRPLTPAQLASFRDIAEELAVPFRQAPDTGGGIGWHSLYPDWNRSGHDCTGAVRTRQIQKLTAAGPATTPVVGDSPLLTLRSTGHKVTDVQHALDLCDPRNRTAHYDGLGKFGPRTLAVLRVFQQHRKLPVTGTTTPETWAALRRVAHPHP